MPLLKGETKRPVSSKVGTATVGTGTVGGYFYVWGPYVTEGLPICDANHLAHQQVPATKAHKRPSRSEPIEPWGINPPPQVARASTGPRDSTRAG